MTNLFDTPFAIASDHGGFELKQHLIAFLKSKNINNFIDLGTNSLERVDHPVFANLMADAIKTHKVGWGILLCGTGIGTSIAANRHKGIHCALCHDVTTARFAREHNNANILTMGGRIIGPILAEQILEAFVSTGFLGDRYQTRIEMIDEVSC